MIEKINYNNYSTKKVIVVDDDKLNANIAIKFLEPYKIKAETVFSAEELFERINSGNIYDLILLDDMMPLVSGTDAMKKLKLNSDFKTPIVVLTGNTIEGARENYLKVGFDEFIAKPINKKEYDKILNMFLK